MNHKAKLVLSFDVYRKIKWLTHNYDNEIGAVGVGKMRTQNGEKQFYVEKLFFPKQKVSSATVHFTSEMWTNLIQNKEFMERMGDMCFYWHKHPGSSVGSAHHSATDDEDTFETFMDPIAKRKWFGFLQTASKTDGTMDTESRIELATPLRVSIEKENIDLLHEHSPEQLKLIKLMKEEEESTKVEMEALVEEVIEKNPIVTPNTWNNKTWNKEDNAKVIDSNTKNYIKGQLDSDNDKAVEHIFGTYEEQGNSLYMDNDMVSGQPTSNEERASMTIGSGQARIKTGEIFEKVLMKALTDDGSPLKPLIKKSHLVSGKKGEMKEYCLQPHKKQYKTMSKVLETIFINYNTWVERRLLEAEIKETTGEDANYSCIINRYSQSYWQIIGEYAVWQLIGELDDVAEMDWDTAGRFCKAYTFGKSNDDKDMIGTIEVTPNGDMADFKGDKLIAVVATQTEDMVAEDCTNLDSKIKDVKEDEEQ